MTIGIVGIKRGMTRVFTDEGVSIPVTVIEATPNRVTQVKSAEKDGYSAIQVTAGEVKASRVNKPTAGHFSKSSIEAGRKLWEFRTTESDELNVGDSLTVEAFEEGQKVDVTRRSTLPLPLSQLHELRSAFDHHPGGTLRPRAHHHEGLRDVSRLPRGIRESGPGSLSGT